MSMRAAPPFDCVACGRRIGKTRGHLIVGDPSADRIVHMRCAEQSRGPVHTLLYPGCPLGWHDLFDHPTMSATRAGAAHVLGIWPTYSAEAP